MIVKSVLHFIHGSFTNNKIWISIFRQNRYFCKRLNLKSVEKYSKRCACIGEPFKSIRTLNTKFMKNRKTPHWITIIRSSVEHIMWRTHWRMMRTKTTDWWKIWVEWIYWLVSSWHCNVATAVCFNVAMPNRVSSSPVAFTYPICQQKSFCTFCDG